jgi:hypothetical protein
MSKEWSESSPKEARLRALSDDVNGTAREQYRSLVAKSGERLYVPTRLALRRDTAYPYAFEERETVIRRGTQGFGEVIFESRGQGIKTINDLTQVALKEHSWVHVPVEEVWIDDTVESDYDRARGDNHLVTFLTHLYPQVETVHTHPDVLGDIGRFDDGIAGRWEVVSARPSGIDLGRHNFLAKLASPDSELITTVVSRYGATSVTLNENGKNTEGYTILDIEHVVDPDNDPHEEAAKVVEVTQQRYVDWDSGIPVFDMTFTPIRPE